MKNILRFLVLALALSAFSYVDAQASETTEVKVEKSKKVEKIYDARNFLKIKYPFAKQAPK